MSKAIGMAEFKTISAGMTAADTMVKTAAVDIIEAVESLRDLKSIIKRGTKINVTMHKNLGGQSHPNVAPVVRVNGSEYRRTNCETVMSQVLAEISKDV